MVVKIMKKIFSKIIKNYFPTVLDIVTLSLKHSPDSKFAKTVINADDKIQNFIEQYNIMRAEVMEDLKEKDINEIVKDIITD